MSKIYTGVGSRETPSEILLMMTQTASLLSELGWCLRSGGADGADTAFEVGHKLEKEIYIPWKNFNNHRTDDYIVVGENKPIMEMASKIHPAWFRCNRGAKLLHTRNICQVLGPDPIANPIPSRFVLAYTQKGELQGGTRTALVCAIQHDIPIFNFGAFEHLPKEMVLDRLQDFLVDFL